MATRASFPSSNRLEALFNHVALPRNVPGREDEDQDEIKHALLQRAYHSFKEFIPHIETRHHDKLQAILRCLFTAQDLHAGLRLEREPIIRSLQNLSGHEALMLHIAEQNAGLLIYLESSPTQERVVFESLETSAPSAKVLAETKALKWDLPDSASSIPISAFRDAAFQESLATFLAEASFESITQFAAVTVKANTTVPEPRDTSNPALISGMLTSLLEGIGASADVIRVRKEIRDTVSWTSGAYKPWRRLPFYLLLRVAIQRRLCHLLGFEEGRIHYKFWMCVFISRLLEESMTRIPPESSAFLKTKLCRRLAKLEMECASAVDSLRTVYQNLFASLRSPLLWSVETVSDRLAKQWGEFKKATERQILPLPLKAGPFDTQLRLAHSRTSLNRVLEQPLSIPSTSTNTPLQLIQNYERSREQSPYMQFAKAYDFFWQAEPEAHTDETLLGNEANCINIARSMEKYIADTLKGFQGLESPEFRSQILISLMEKWVAMDKYALGCYPLLGDHHPGLCASLLDSLQVLTLADMQRIQEIDLHLKSRERGCKYPGLTIFHNPSEDCFAVHYYDMTESLQSLRRKIEDDAEQAREETRQVWLGLKARYESLQRQIIERDCEYSEDAETQQFVHFSRCHKCSLVRQANAMTIKALEHPLPPTESTLKAVVFELSPPGAFASYRDATWRILETIAALGVTSNERVTTLSQFEPLMKKPYRNTGTHNVTLATTDHPFTGSHYRSRLFYTVNAVEDLFYSCGVRWHYCDNASKRWMGTVDTERVTFAHHLRFQLPYGSPFPHTIPSSTYVVQANQSTCPPDVNVQEYIAFQSILTETHGRWDSFLRELSSPSLNFSSESTLALVSRLALEAGPANGDPLRVVHAALYEGTFGQRLMQHIRQRLGDIECNWREAVCMHALLTVILKLHSLAPDSEMESEALELVLFARKTTVGWIDALRSAIRSSVAGTSQEHARYGVYASLLCRHTFLVHSYADSLLNEADLKDLVSSSIFLQENLSTVSAVPPSLRGAILADLRLIFSLQALILDSIEAHPNALLDALDVQLLSRESGSATEIEFLTGVFEYWIQIPIESVSQVTPNLVQYNYLFGHLLVNGQPLGELPVEHRNWPILRKLFGNQKISVYPSTMPGMTFYVDRQLPYNHRIHLGFRDNQLVIRAHKAGAVLELINPRIFGVFPDFDFPASLVWHSTFWLDIHSGIMEIRQDPELWKSKDSNWWVNVKRGLAMRRPNTPRKVTLVCPRSPLFQKVSRNFHYFENPCFITVFQPADNRRNLSVEMRRMDLSFVVNRRGLLQSRQLGAVVDRNQDAGTWYGLRSKLVIQSIRNQRLRSILVPIGKLNYRLAQYQGTDIHVRIEVDNEGNYAKFTINPVLGRIECASEPWLQFLKLQWHAYTSHFVPDPLTGRTGTEEAISYLQSGALQPWTALAAEDLRHLLTVSRLTPNREFYPRHLKCMEKVAWDHNLTTTIQDDRYRGLVEAVCQKSATLSRFHTKEALNSTAPTPDGNDPVLESRAIARSAMYRRLPETVQLKEPDQARIYPARGHRLTKPMRSQCGNVFNCTRMISNWSVQLRSRIDIAEMLQDFELIGGYTRPFSQGSLSDRLSANIGMEWGALAASCRESVFKDRYSLMFLFAPFAFTRDARMDLIHALIATAITPEIQTIEPPKWPSYSRFYENQRPEIDTIVELIDTTKVTYDPGVRASLVSHGSLTSRDIRKINAERKKHETQADQDCITLSKFLLSQWPRETLTMDGFTGFTEEPLIDAKQAFEIVRLRWPDWVHNYQLWMHLSHIQPILDKLISDAPILDASHTPTSKKLELWRTQPSTTAGCPLRSLEELAQKDFPPGREGRMSDSSSMVTSSRTCISSSAQQPSLKPPNAGGVGDSKPEPTEISTLRVICARFTNSQSSVRSEYGKDLDASIDALMQIGGLRKQEPGDSLISLAEVRKAISHAHNTVQAKARALKVALEDGEPAAEFLKAGVLWPAMTPITLLELLRSQNRIMLEDGMRRALVEYGIALTALQRLLRMEGAWLKDKISQVKDEVLNPGHQSWDPRAYPDWLLIEVDNNLMIRPVQYEVAREIICPASNSNAAIQLLMGQGKSSVILPMVAVVLANCQHLLRIIVPSPLLQQSAQVLQARLGSLLGRRIMHIPFSRRTSTRGELIEHFRSLHAEILGSSGVILALPEHLLSFRLSGLQRLSDGRVEEAKRMINLQKWLDGVARDVLDECDFTLAMRTQLIYPSGSQAQVDGHPQRWQAAETLLHLVKEHLPKLEADFPRSIEVFRKSSSGFPFVFLLRKDVEDALVARLVDDVCGGDTSVLPSKAFNGSEREDLKDFISSSKISNASRKRVEEMFADSPEHMKTIYLLRGLFVHRIFLSSLKKRFNVQFGLHSKRPPVAVPFQAKGVASDTSEWGHPDVAILLTILSFYHAGITSSQLRQALRLVFRSDDPGTEYARFVSEDMPDSLREWHNINVEDDSQLAEIHKHVWDNILVIEYYLNNYVFPSHAKSYATKLQASGWDLVLPSAEADAPKTTGFSGTNDGRNMLPLNIEQRDLASLAHTNAEVLVYLLQGRNREYSVMAGKDKQRLSEVGVLQKLHENRLKILIDAGAQILAHDNLSLSKAWLSIDSDAPCVVYFHADNSPWVRLRKGTEIPLLASPFAENLTDCLVYMDEAHTRGTDLKFPSDARAALTLGLNLTKDSLVQAAMRLRLLGTTQCVVFFAPLEVHHSIMDLCGIENQAAADAKDNNDQNDGVCSEHVIRWLLEQTCSNLEASQPLYFSQGMDFCRRSQASLDFPDYVDNASHREQYLGIIRSAERQSLKQLYDPKQPKPPSDITSYSPTLESIIKTLAARRQGFQDTGNAVHASVLQEVEVEQERETEVSLTVESVREIQRPRVFYPLDFPGLHEHIDRFAKIGILVWPSPAYEHVSSALGKTALGRRYDLKFGTGRSALYISTEFSRTVRLPHGQVNDDFMRPVQWVLWNRITETALIIIPEEANFLIPILRRATASCTHLITYAEPVTHNMLLNFNEFDFRATPALPHDFKAPIWLKVEVGFFAGRLFLGWEEYDYLMKYLFGAEISDIPVPSKTAHRAKDVRAFLKEWLAMRRKGQEFENTPMGFIAKGRMLSSNHSWFKSIQESEYESHASTSVKGKKRKEVQELEEVEEDDGSDSDDSLEWHDAEDGKAEIEENNEEEEAADPDVGKDFIDDVEDVEDEEDESEEESEE